MPSDDPFTIKAVLDGLRGEVGDADLGYRAQGLFAHVLLRLGARVLEINAQGHPDIKAHVDDATWLVQVKSILHNSALPVFGLSADDIEGLMPNGTGRGFLALLDCAEPIEVVIVAHERLASYTNRALHVASVRADREIGLSGECTEEFVDLVRRHAERLRYLTFRVLSRRALLGDVLFASANSCLPVVRVIRSTFSL